MKSCRRNRGLEQQRSTKKVRADRSSSDEFAVALKLVVGRNCSDDTAPVQCFARTCFTRNVDRAFQYGLGDKTHILMSRNETGH